jgi:hypothetical protein
MHKKLLEDVLIRGYKITDEKLNELTKFSKIHSRVILYGVQEIDDLELSYKTELINNFTTGYDGLNNFIEKEAINRSYKDFSNWVLEKLKFAENYFIRTLSDIPKDEIEEKFVIVIGILENFLQSQYASTLLPLLKEFENEIKLELTNIYNDESLTENEAIDKAFSFLDTKQKEITDKFQNEIQKTLNDEAIKQYLSVALLLDLDKLSDAEIQRQRQIVERGYNLNISNFFSSSIHKVKMLFSDNIGHNYNQRSIATDQLNSLEFTKNFNENTFKLSTISESRRLFRGLVAKASKTENFKMLVPYSILPSLNPSGITAKNLYLIKIKDEWAKTNGLTNIAVVEGLGLHYGSQEYYKPVFNLEKEKELAILQRQEFLKSI